MTAFMECLRFYAAGIFVMKKGFLLGSPFVFCVIICWRNKNMKGCFL